MECRGTEMTRTAVERAVIGALIMGQAVPSLLDIETAHFLDPLCRRLFIQMAQMEREGQEIDLVSVCAQDETLNAAAVVDLSQECPVSEVLTTQHCARLRDMSLRRAYEALLNEALTRRGSVREEIDALRARLGGLLAQQRSDLPGEQLDLLLCELMEEFGREMEKEAAPIATGVSKIDELLCGGFRPGDLAVVAALTSVGKSAMLSFMARNAAAQRRRILLVSCEMSATQNAERFLASISHVPLSQIMRRERMTDEQSISVSEGLNLYKPEYIRVLSSGSMTPALVRRDAMRMKTSIGLDLIVVDYLQRLRTDRAGATRAEDVGAIAAALKSMAVDLNVPVLTAAQFNREAAKGRSEYRGQEQLGVPALHQLRDSSQIEDEANCVIVLDEPKRVYEGLRHINAHVVKNRSGALGVVRLRFNGESMKFDDGKE